MATEDWIEAFPKAHVKHLPRTHSDHYLIMLTLGSKTNPHKHKIFRSESMWASYPDLIEIIKGSWRNETDILKVISIFEKEVTKWNRLVYGNIFNREKTLLKRIGASKDL